jgi:hypothetical protein
LRGTSQQLKSRFEIFRSYGIAGAMSGYEPSRLNWSLEPEFSSY